MGWPSRFSICMRASSQEQKGDAGANEVAANFERIGWGYAENSEHDLGTDLFLVARACVPKTRPGP